MKYKVQFTASVTTYRIVEAESEDEAAEAIECLEPDDMDNAAMSDDIDVWDVRPVGTGD